jgi:glycosyltransferase 2 family protein
MRKHLIAALKYCISFLLIGVIIYLYRDKLDEVAELLRGANISLLIATFIGSILLIFMFAWRLKLMLSAQDVDVSVWNAFVVAMAGYFFNNFVPSAIGADLFKGVYLSRGSNKTKEVFSALLVDRVIGVITLIVIAFVAILFRRELFADKNVSYTIMLMTGGTFLICLFFTNKSLARLIKPLVNLIPHKRAVDILRNFYDAIHGYKKHPGIVLSTLGISVVAQLLFYVSIYLLSKAIHVNASLNLFFVFIPLISLAAIAPSLNGLGVRDVMFVYFFGKYCSDEGALAIAILMDALFISLGLVGGLIFAFAGKLRLQNLKKASVS